MTRARFTMPEGAACPEAKVAGSQTYLCSLTQASYSNTLALKTSKEGRSPKILQAARVNYPAPYLYRVQNIFRLSAQNYG